LLLEPVAFEVEAPAWLDLIVVTACVVAWRTASPADAPARFSAASPAGDATGNLEDDASEEDVLEVVLHVWLEGKRCVGQNWPLHVCGE
jgi:hypothetical protein